MALQRLTDFAKSVKAQYAVGHPETFWSCQSALEQLISNGAIAHWFNEQLTALGQDPNRLGDWAAKEVVLQRSNGWSLSVAFFDTPRRFIHALPFFAFYVPLE